MEQLAANPKSRLFDSRDMLPSVHWAQLQHVDQTPGRMRRIYDFEVIYIIKGEMHVHFSDMNSPVVYKAGDLLFLHPAVWHRIEVPLKAGSRMIGIHFDLYDDLEVISDIHMIVQEGQVDWEMFCCMPVNGNGERLFPSQYSSVPIEVSKWMEAICEEFAAAKPGFEMTCRGLMLLIVTALLRHQTISERTRYSSHHDGLRELTEQWIENIHLSWSNETMAKRLNVSEDHFIRLFKELYGLTPGRYVQYNRHQEAKRCLRDTDLKVEYIGKSIGYDDLHHFSRVFKKWQGVSPREYRKMCDML